MERRKNDRFLQAGFDEARDLTRKHAKSFYFALQFLKRERRRAVYAVYALCRMIDDAVDELQDGPKEKRLQEIQDSIDQAYRNHSPSSDLMRAFQNTVLRYKIPREYFDELIAGMHMDLKKHRYHNFTELRLYCYRVAGVIGLIMVKILGYRNEEAFKPAVDLGIAMQLTNILRDVREDYDRGRIYFPQDEMRRFGITEANLKGEREDKLYKDFLRFQVERARFYYHNAARVAALMKDANGRFVVQLMKELYAGILDVIEAKNYDVNERAYVNTSKKIFLLLKVASTCPLYR